MWSNKAALEHGRGTRLLRAIVAGIAVLVATTLFLFDVGFPPKRVRAEAAVAALALAGGGGGGGPARPSTTRLCLHGPGGEILDFAPGQRCP
jgi:hypothetical protein